MKVVDGETKTPLIGANVTIVNSKMGTATDRNGTFILDNIPVGNYSLQVGYIGYLSTIKSDIIVRSNRITHAEVRLTVSAIESEEILVTGSYFEKNTQHPLIDNIKKPNINHFPTQGASGGPIGLPHTDFIAFSNTSMIFTWQHMVLNQRSTRVLPLVNLHPESFPSVRINAGLFPIVILFKRETIIIPAHLSCTISTAFHSNCFLSFVFYL